ncbi:cyclin-like protein, partial [Suillus cothurnatus]
DTTTDSEYTEEILKYMNSLEEDMMPDPNYMKSQKGMTWAMRQTLVDWLLQQVHMRWHLLPETLWVAVNLIDRFLTKCIISPMKLPLVGITALMIAAKYEEGRAPSINEFVLITNDTFTKEDILESECMLLQTLEFKISQYCSPYLWIHSISVNADNHETRTKMLGTFLAEVTLLDCKFLRCKPSLIAAIGMYSARQMLGRDWNVSFIQHSGFVAEHLKPGHRWICEKLTEDNFGSRYVCRIYATEKFLGVSSFAIQWARLTAQCTISLEALLMHS